MQTIKDLGSYTFPSLFKNTVKKFGKFNALSMVHGNPITYKELEELSVKAAKVLYKNNFVSKKKVAIFSPGMPQWGAMYLAIVCNGGIALPLLPDFTEVEVESILKHAQVDTIVVSERLYSKLQKLPEGILNCIIKIEDYSPYKGVEADFDKDELPAPVEVFEEDTASIIYTSGTTGRSKGVELTHKNLVWTAIQCQTVHRVNKSDRCLSFLPLSHVYEFTIGFVMQILNGSCIYYLEKAPTVSTLMPAFKIVRPTVILSVPLIMEKIYKNKILPTFSSSEKIAKMYEKPFWHKQLNKIAGKKLKKTMGGKIKFFGIGGAKTDPEVEKFMKEAHFPYAVGYGLTETSPLLAGSSPKNTIPGTIGPILEGVELKILNPDEKTGIGEVVARGPNVMKGYYKDKEITAEAFTTDEDSCGAGWFKTGDLGIIEFYKKVPYLSLKGRSKNMILGSSGENIYPEDIEFVLNQHPMVSESLVVEGEKGTLVALVKLAENVGKVVGGAVKNVTEDLIYKKDEIMSEIQFFVNNKVNRNCKIGSVQTVDEFEKTASQKIKRYKYNLKDTPTEGEDKEASSQNKDSTLS